MFRTLPLDMLDLEQYFASDFLGLRLAENMGPLIVLEYFLEIANQLFQVTEAKQLPAIKADIDNLHNQVKMLYQSGDEPVMLSDDGLNTLLFQTALYLYYLKCIELKVRLYDDERRECQNVKNALTFNLPNTHYSFSPMTNLVFGIVLATKEVISLPQSLDRVEYQKIQEHLMAAQAILLTAANSAKLSRESDQLDPDVRRGLSCMLRGYSSNGTAMDKYAKGLANLAYTRISAWCASIKKRRESIEMKGMDSLYHYEEALVTLCGFFNVEAETDFQKEVMVQRNKFLPFDQSDQAACEAYYVKLLAKVTKRCNELEKIMHSIIHGRATDEEGALTWQRIATNALNIFYTELLAARIHLQAGFATFSHAELGARIERSLEVLAKIYATAIVDAIPRQSNTLTIFNKLWLLREVAADPTDAELSHIINFGAESDVLASLVSVWLVSKVTCHLSADKPEFRSNRIPLIDSLLYRLNHILKMGDDCADEKKKKLIYQIAVDLYLYTLKFCSSSNENKMMMTEDMQKRIAVAVQKAVHVKRNQFVLETMGVLKAVNKNASDLTREFVIALERNDPKKYKRIFELARDGFRDMDFFDKRRMNYHALMDFQMYTTIVFAKTSTKNCVHGVKLSFYRHDAVTTCVRLVKELGIEAMELCGAKMEMIELPAPLKPAAEPKQPIDEKIRAANSASFLPESEPRKPTVAAKPKPRRAKNSGRGNQRNTEAKVTVPVAPKVSANFKDFEAFFANDYTAIAAHLREQIALPRAAAVDKYSALVKLAHCLEKLKDPVLMAFIQNNTDQIFQDAKMFYTDRSELNEDRAYVYGVLAKLEADDRSDKSDTCSSNTLSDSSEEETEEADLESLQPAVTAVAATMYAKPESKKLNHRRIKLTFQQIIDKYKPQAQTQPAKFPFTNGQWEVMLRIKECGHRTFVHGSSIISLLRDAAVTDIDLLCYVDTKQLQQYFTDHAEALGISWTSMDMNNQQILHVYLKEKKRNGDPVKMELACHGKLSDADMLTDMRKMLVSYYFSNMLADPYSGNFIDLFRQYEWIAVRNKITSVVKEPKSSVKFYDWAMGMVKFVARNAYFKSQNKPFKSTYELRYGVIVNADQLAFDESRPDHTINNIDFEKLYLRGHAKHSFDEFMFFDLFRILFPAFEKMNSEQMQAVGTMFAEFDRYLKEKYKFDLTDEQNGKETIELLSRLVICYLEINKIKQSLCKDVDALRAKIKFVLTDINLMRMDKLAPAVQHHVIKRLYKLDQKPKNKTGQKLFIPQDQTKSNMTPEQFNLAKK